jgi:predicted RNA-binding protein YlxR (DUF448 family)
MLARPDDAETDRGPRHGAAGAARLCIVTRAVTPTEEMIRFVAGPDRALVPDLKRKLPGRGVWVTARRDLLAEATRRGAFARALKADVKVAADLPAVVESLIERALLDALAIARKAGQVVAGHAKVEAVAERAAAAGFLQAAGAGAEGVRQIMAAIRRGYGADAENVVVIDAFTSAQLDLALARPNVVHAALLAGRASDTVLARWRTLARFRMGDPGRQDIIQQPQDVPGAHAAPGKGSKSGSE